MKLFPIAAALILLAGPAFAQQANNLDTGVAQVTGIVSMMRGQILNDSQTIDTLQKQVDALKAQLEAAKKPAETK